MPRTSPLAGTTATEEKCQNLELELSESESFEEAFEGTKAELENAR